MPHKGNGTLLKKYGRYDGVKKNKRIAIALSGGIDSLVAAYILKQKNIDLFGIHFKTGYEDETTDLSTIGACLGIEIKYIDLSKDFDAKVIDYFIDTYLKGKTPNPCILCNKKIKFDSLYKAGAKLGADMIATGHYAAIKKDKSGHHYLTKAKDLIKDQSYFLAMLSREQLDRAIFPLGDMYKSEVKEIARANNLIPSEKKESQDICFIKKDQSFADFICSKQNIKPIPGNIIKTNGEIIGRHKGLHEFTIGQRRGLNCPGPAPYYVKKIDIKNNALVVGFKEELFSTQLIVNNIHWTGDPITSCCKIETKIRYRHQAEEALFIPEIPESRTLSGINPPPISHIGKAKIIFNKPQYAVTPGQIAAFYYGNNVLGCGIIQ